MMDEDERERERKEGKERGRRDNLRRDGKTVCSLSVFQRKRRRGGRSLPDLERYQ